MRLLQGDEYAVARSEANAANRVLHQANPEFNGMEIHEVQPVKFGGSPTDLANKAVLPPTVHSEFTNWWSQLMRDLSGR